MMPFLKYLRGYANAALVEGEELTVLNLLNVLLIPSANDAAFVLGEHIGGSFDNFSDMMNQKALEIGCTNTHFVNPNGIHDENHYTTAYDLALMGQYAMKSEIIRQIVSTTRYVLPATNKYDKTDRIFNTTNELIKPSSKYYYSYATGCKTGYTEAAKNCIIATAKKDDVELLVVLLHDTKSEDGTARREVDCKTLFEYGFNNFENKKIASQNDVIKNITVSGGSHDTKSLDLVIDKDIYAFIPTKYNLNNIKETIAIDDNIKAPIIAGTIMGKVSYIADGTSYTTNLIASHNVDTSRLVPTLLGIFLIITIIFLLIFITRNIKLKISKSKSDIQTNYRTIYNDNNRNGHKLSHIDYFNQQKR